MKSIIAAGLLLGAAHGMAASAGTYANVEANSGFVGSDYQGTVTETHIGYEGELSETADYYVQAGPAFVSEDSGDTSTEISGKAGVNVAVAEQVDVYGEVSFITDEDDNSYGTKVGLKYRF